MLALTLAILWPYEFVFRLSARVILKDHADVASPTPVADLKAFLARALESHHDRNQQQLKRLVRCFQAACASLAAETVAWLVAI